MLIGSSGEDHKMFTARSRLQEEVDGVKDCDQLVGQRRKAVH